MSLPESTEPRRGVYDRKPGADIYTVLLAISLVAVLIAIICLVLEMATYDFEFRAQAQAAPASPRAMEPGQLAPWTAEIA